MASESGGSKSTIKSCGSISAATVSASARDSTARVRWRGANFFRAEVIAAASASYSSTRRTLDAVPVGVSCEAGTAVASEKAEDRRSVAHVKAKQRKLHAFGADTPLWRYGICAPGPGQAGSRIALLEAQGLDWVEGGCAVGRIKPETDADRRADDEAGNCPAIGKD